MKFKNLFLLLTILGTVLVGFSSCSSDDDNPYEGYTSLNKTYASETLKISDKAAATGVNVKVEATGTNANAKLTLTNMIAGESSLVINDAQIKLDGTKYTVSATNSNDNRDYSFTATVENNVMTVVSSTVKIKSAIVGKWAVKVNPKTDVILADYMDVTCKIVTSDATQTQIATIINTFLPFTIGQQMNEKVSYVNAEFKDNGVVDISYLETKAGAVETHVSSLVGTDIHYYVNNTDKKVYLAVDKTLINGLLAALATTLQENNIDQAKLMALLVDAGAYYAIPLDFKVDGTYTVFYMQKPYLTQILGVIPQATLNGLIAGIPMGQQALSAISTADSVEIGLGFNKVQ